MVKLIVNIKYNLKVNVSRAAAATFQISGSGGILYNSQYVGQSQITRQRIWCDGRGRGVTGPWLRTQASLQT